MPAPQIAAMVRTGESHVRKVIHAFNERGFASLDPDYRRASQEDHARAARSNRVGRARPPRYQGCGVDAPSMTAVAWPTPRSTTTRSPPRSPRSLAAPWTSSSIRGSAPSG
ncbi:MAG: hypothetical protein ACXVSE_12130 [Solirubrobacteraceae bacterium]